jgi:hypothetical protein
VAEAMTVLDDPDEAIAVGSEEGVTSSRVLTPASSA